MNLAISAAVATNRTFVIMPTKWWFSPEETPSGVNTWYHYFTPQEPDAFCTKAEPQSVARNDKPVLEFDVLKSEEEVVWAQNNIVEGLSHPDNNPPALFAYLVANHDQQR